MRQKQNGKENLIFEFIGYLCGPLVHIGLYKHKVPGCPQNLQPESWK